MPNYDETTGIRYGVISPESISSWSLDEIYQNGTDPQYDEYMENTEQEYRDEHTGDQFDQDELDSILDNCAMEYQSDGSGIMDYSDNEYDLHVSGDNFGIFVMKSPYYTYCRGCSPCAPGAGDLDAPMTSYDGPISTNYDKALCLGPEWFDKEESEYARKIPYRVFRVDNDEEAI